MGYVITQFAPWIFLGALGLGLLVGLFTWDRKTSGSWLSGWLSWAAILFVIGVFAAIFKLIAGRGGLWLETALIMFAVYIVGCLLGNWFRGLFAAAEPVLSAEARAGIGAQARTMTARSAAAGQAGAGATASGVPGSPASEFPPAPDDAPLAIDSSRSYPGQRPLGLAKPERALDDLTRLGVLTGSDQKILNDLGIHHARQIAGWSPENADWINHHIARPGRVQAEGWIGKAAAFVNRQASQAGATGATAGLAGNVLMAGTAAAGDKTATGSGQVSAAGAATAGGSSGAGASGSAGSAASLGGAVPAPAQAVAGSGPVTGVSPTAGSAAAAGQSAGSAGTASSPPAGVAGTPGGSADKGVESVSASPLAGVAAGGSSTLPQSSGGSGHAGTVGAAGAAVIATGTAGSQVVHDPMAGSALPGDVNASHPGLRPYGLLTAPIGSGDDLKRIRGISPGNERELNRLGLYHFRQIGQLKPEECQ